ncbi:LOW QUALITY PROTEIN: exosome complex component RRP41-like [Centruroides vittatus]|uniref:LOW QUALITY PROTEIN: exosome complex component RRP41-like n=1 Tax=Centruroides vittatus TaxID=120091 RepID=UPI0035105D83
MEQEELFDQGFRIDGRKANELRQVNCRLGVFDQADGSAYLEQGNTKVLAAIYGPHEVRGKSKALYDRVLLNCQYSMTTFSTGERKKRPRGDKKSQEISLQLRQTFESAILIKQFPKSQIDIFFEVLQADDGNYSACVNAGTLALADAGILLKDFVCSCSGGLINDKPIVDINYQEESFGTPTLILAILPKTEEIVLAESFGRLHIDLQNKLMDQTIKGCGSIYEIMDEALRQHVNKINCRMRKD